jgi:hypothetical protein
MVITNQELIEAIIMLKRITRTKIQIAFERVLVKTKPPKELPWYGAEMQIALSKILKY